MQREYVIHCSSVFTWQCAVSSEWREAAPLRSPGHSSSWCRTARAARYTGTAARLEEHTQLGWSEGTSTVSVRLGSFTPLPSVSGAGRTPDRSRGGADAAARGDSGVASGMTLSELSVWSGNAVTDSGVQAIGGGTSDGVEELTLRSVKLSDSSRSEVVSFVSLSATWMFPVVFVSSVQSAVSNVRIIRHHNAAMLGYSALCHLYLGSEVHCGIARLQSPLKSKPSNFCGSSITLKYNLINEWVRLASCL